MLELTKRLVLIPLVLLGASACSGSGTNRSGPGGAAVALSEAINGAKIDEALSFFPGTNDPKDGPFDRSVMIGELPKLFRQARAYPFETRILKEDVNGDLALVTMEVTTRGNRQVRDSVLHDFTSDRTDTLIVGFVHSSGKWLLDWSAKPKQPTNVEDQAAFFMQFEMVRLGNFEDQYALYHGGEYFSGTGAAQGYQALRDSDLAVVATALSEPKGWKIDATHRATKRKCTTTKRSAAATLAVSCDPPPPVPNSVWNKILDHLHA